MEVVEFKEGDVLVLLPDGSVVGREETNAIERKLGAALKSGARLLVIDCTHVGQLTSAAIRLLLTTSRKLEGRDGRLVLCSMNAQVKKAFAISGFDEEFTIAATRDEALPLVIEPPNRRSTRAAKKSLPKAVVRADVPAAAAGPVRQGADPAGVAPSSRSAEQTMRAVESSAPSPSPDRRDQLADTLLKALGVSLANTDAARSSRARLNSDALSREILTALRFGAP